MNKIEIRSFDMDARGVGHLQNEDGTQGKVVFVEGALPGELVSFSSYKKNPSWEVATLSEVHRTSSQRVDPKCEFLEPVVVVLCSIWSLTLRLR